MADPRAFISFDFDNNETEKHLFAGQSKHSETPFSIEDWSSKTHLPQNQWERLIEAKIGATNMLIVLVGNTTAWATGVVKEISFARKNNVPIFGVYVDGANSSTHLPEGLARNRVIDWEWNSIASAIRQLMGEGKNK
ncbi:MAG: TIR domain-containing protein [Candidatus Pacebacteria bacterium]|nr:TIR domain-containing protein [Candidatus Paceibacterota bacterium]